MINQKVMYSIEKKIQRDIDYETEKRFGLAPLFRAWRRIRWRHGHVRAFEEIIKTIFSKLKKLLRLN